MSISSALKVVGKAVAAVGATRILGDSVNGSMLGEGISSAVQAIGKVASYVNRPLRSGVDYLNAMLFRTVSPPIYYRARFPIGISDIKLEECFWEGPGPFPYQCHMVNVTVLTGISEEIFYRGVLQKVLLPWVGRLLPSPFSEGLSNKIIRIALASLLFNAMHDAPAPYQFVAGVVFGAMAEESSLPVSILAHVIHNSWTLYWNVTRGLV